MESCARAGGFDTTICTSHPNAFRNRNNRSLENPSSRTESSAETLGRVMPNILPASACVSRWC